MPSCGSRPTRPATSPASRCPSTPASSRRSALPNDPILQPPAADQGGTAMTTTSGPTSKVDVDIPGLDQVFIAGEWRRSVGNATWNVVSPSTEEVVATVALPTEGD